MNEASYFSCASSALTQKIGKPHFWSEIIVSHLYFITLIDNLRRLPFVATLTRLLFPSTLAMQNKNSQYARQKVAE